MTDGGSLLTSMSPGILESLTATVLWRLVEMGLAAKPYFGEPRPSKGNLQGENHWIWNVPIHWKAFRIPVPLAWCTVECCGLSDEFSESLTFAVAWIREPKPVALLVPGMSVSVPLFLRSVSGETVRLSTSDRISPIECPQNAMRLLTAHEFWGMGESHGHFDLPPGDHAFRIVLKMAGRTIGNRAFHVHVPGAGMGNGAVTLTALEATHDEGV